MEKTIEVKYTVDRSLKAKPVQGFCVIFLSGIHTVITS